MNPKITDLTLEDLRSHVKDCFVEFFFSEEEDAPFNRLNDKINKLLEATHAEERVEFSAALCDKFDDYMKNIDKLNLMINEFKGLVSIVRGEAKSVQKENLKLKKQMRKILETLAE